MSLKPDEQEKADRNSLDLVDREMKLVISPSRVAYEEQT